ncbi:hypothetical protein [Azospirillum sp. TSO35-2]|uniref:hypothetical protein n=1 Tax=Azospirillum sp. TSO35-2 TaxID=716796 RepID=UPI000D61AD2C|nr:hypothetical protein [Azospirillum sp. TSO35-2]PWC39270.1 hypothetical protein TSO352_03490 [Azospirillum sp. TSO35-2]
MNAEDFLNGADSPTIDDHIAESAQRFGVPPDLVGATMRAESAADPLSLLPNDAVLIGGTGADTVTNPFAGASAEDFLGPPDALALLPPDAVILSAEEFLGEVGRPAPKPTENPSFASVRRGFSRFKQGAAGIAADVGLLTPETAGKTIAEEQRYQQQIAAPKETQDAMRRMSEAGSVADFLSALYEQPGALLTIMGESLGQGGPGMAVGALGAFGGPVGFGAAQGVASGATEYASSVLQSLGDAGVDLSDPISVQAGLSDPERMAAAREFALKRGVPVGLFDGLSAGLAGKITRLAGGPQSVRGAFGRGLSEMGLQAGAGAAGEAGAQLASEGRISKPGDVALEGVAEIPGGLVETGIGARVRGRERFEAAPQAVEEAPPARIEEKAPARVEEAARPAPKPKAPPKTKPKSSSPRQKGENDFADSDSPKVLKAQAGVKYWGDVMDTLHLLLNPITDGDASTNTPAPRRLSRAERVEFERRWRFAREAYLLARDRLDKAMAATGKSSQDRAANTYGPRAEASPEPGVSQKRTNYQTQSAGAQLQPGDRVLVVNKKTGQSYEATLTGERGPRTLVTRDDGKKLQPLTRAHRIERAAA